MAIKMQQRRGTATQWTTANPILSTGEIGYESNTGQFKIGDGTTTWANLPYFKDSSDMLPGQANGIATLDSTGNIPVTQLANLIGDAPAILDTLSELAGAIEDANGIVASKIGTAVSAVHSTITTEIGQSLSDSKTYTDNYVTNAIASEVTNRASAISTAIATEVTNRNSAISTGVSTAETFATGAVSTHNSATTNVHGISDTSALVVTTDSRLSNARTPSDLSVTTGKIADSAVTSAKIADGTIVAGDIADGAITSAKILDGTIVDADINASAAIATSKISGLDTALAAKAPLSSPTFTGTVNAAAVTLSGVLTLSGAPTSDLHAATKAYVDGVTAGINFHAPVKAATSTNISTTYSNGTAGYGATLTADANGAMGTVDGVTMAIGDRILVRSQTDAKQNGIYTVTSLGGASSKWVITRAADADNNPNGELAGGDFCFVTSGTNYGSTGFIVSNVGTVTIGTDNVNYVQFNAAQAITAGTGISKTGSTLSIDETYTATKSSVDLKAPKAAPSFTGGVTVDSSGIIFTDATQTKAGVPSITTINQQAGAYTPVLTDRDKLVEVNSASGVTLTIPANASVAYPVGTSFDILQTGAGQVTIAGAGGVTVNATPGLKLRTQWSSATLFKRATDTWVVYGDLTA